MVSSMLSRSKILTRQLLNRHFPKRTFCAIAQKSYQEINVMDLNDNPALIDEFVHNLSPEVLQRLKENVDMETEGDDSLPNINALSLVALQASIPMVGFGFLDNFLMILMGASIEAGFGSILGLSVMASAACGNTLSDMGGVCMGKYVEIIAEKLNVPKPRLSAKQKTYGRTKFAEASGAILGVGFGCILGMIPLYLYKPELSLELLENIFHKIDSDSNGALDRNEIIQFLDSSKKCAQEQQEHLNYWAGSALNASISESSIDWLIAKYDINNDENLDFGEICLMLQDFGVLQREHSMPVNEGGVLGWLRT